MQKPGRPVACLVPRSRVERGNLPSGGTIVRPKGGVHAAGTRLDTNTVPLLFSVAESVPGTTTVGSAFKVDPKPHQLSPSQPKVKGL